TSRRFVRSPEAPNITRTQGSARLSFCSAVMTCSGLDVSTKFVAHRGQQLVAEIRLVARAQPGVKRCRKNIGRDAGFDGTDDRPASFAGIVHIAGITRELRVL